MNPNRYEDGLVGGYIPVWNAVFQRQRAFAEHAFGQLDDASFFRVVSPGLNSVAVIARHMGGNLLSRWTDFLTADGEKDSRDRDAELRPIGELRAEQAARVRSEIMDTWDAGWRALTGALEGLTEDDLSREVLIRSRPHVVYAAIARQLDHYAFHVGQINVIARQLVGTEAWRWFTLPPDGTADFNDRMFNRA